MDKEMNFVKSFFKEEEDSLAISKIEESIKRVKDSYSVDDSKKYIRELFNIVAHFWYIKNTEKTWRELEESGYNYHGMYSWADGLTGEEWSKDDIISIIQSAILEADFYLEQEYK